MLEIDTSEGRRDQVPHPGDPRASNSEIQPQNPINLINPEQAQAYVKRIKHEFWVNIEPREHGLSNAYARMEIAKELFSIAPINHPEYTPDQVMGVTRSIELAIEARERYVKTKYNHLSKEPDLWADNIIKVLEKRKNDQKNGTVIYLSESLRRRD